jgi:hypothetical protein
MVKDSSITSYAKTCNLRLNVGNGNGHQVPFVLKLMIGIEY